MAKKSLRRIVRGSTATEKRRHRAIREKTNEEFAGRRKRVSTSRVILAKLRSQRQLKGLSLADVARRTGMARSNLCRLERDGENVQLETLERYAAAIECQLVVEIRQSQATE
jgi:DNA-binding Xre family transcriptional regulator